MIERVLIVEEDNAVGIKSILNKMEVSLILDTYDDIFSDFDPRPYSERSLSEDFLSEAKRATRDKGEGVELRFLIPKVTRSLSHEELIKQRLKEHFRRHYKSAKKAILAYKQQALLLILIGIILGLVDALTLSTPVTFDLNAILTDAIGIVLTPASWFSIWTGLEHLIYQPKEEVAEEAFYKKMESVHITFTSY